MHLNHTRKLVLVAGIYGVSDCLSLLGAGINVCVEMGDLRAAQQVLAAMRVRCHDHSSLPSPWSLSSEAGATLLWWYTPQDMGHSPDAQAWNTLIKGYARAGLLTILPDLIADMQLEVQPESSRNDSLLMTGSTCSDNS